MPMRGPHLSKPMGWLVASGGFHLFCWKWNHRILTIQRLGDISPLIWKDQINKILKKKSHKLDIRFFCFAHKSSFIGILKKGCLGHPCPMSWDAPRLKTGILKMKPRCPDLQYWWVKISDEIGIFSRSILVFQTLLSMERTFMHYFHIEIWWLHHGVFDDFCIQCGTKSGKAILFESHLWHVYLESRNRKFSPYHHISRWWFLSTTSKYSTVIPWIQQNSLIMSTFKKCLRSMSNTRTEDKHKASLAEICRQRFIADARHLPRGVSRSEKYSMLHIWNVFFQFWYLRQNWS